ncbi:MAG: sulfatase-like hydrolase/transferase, partial [Verrucomicrobiales bacterium]
MTTHAVILGRESDRGSTLNGCYIPGRDEVTMGHVFSEGGYGTAMFGKWHLGDTWPYGAEHRGFQHVVRHGAGVVGEVPDYWKNDYFDDTYLKNGVWEPFEGFCTDIWFEEAMDYIRSRKARPFFCYLATNAPHGPFNVHDRYVKPYLEAGVPEKRARFYGLIANLDENLGRLMDFLDREGLTDNTILIFMGDNGTSLVA